MRKSLRLLVLPVAFLGMGVVAQARTPKVGEVAPSFELSLVNGQKVTLADLRGQVVVLNFWATWCVPCRAELPALDAYYKLQKSHGLRVVAITTEDSIPEKKLHELFSAMTIEPIHKLKGPYAYIDHAVPTNFAALQAFRDHVRDLWRRPLRRRSQRDNTTYERMKKLANDWLPRPRILHPWPRDRFAVRHPRWEPYAGIPPVRFCAGGTQ